MNIRNLTASILLAAGVAITGLAVAGPASAAGSWECHGTAGSKVDAPSSCVTTPGHVTPPAGYPMHRRHGHRHGR